MIWNILITIIKECFLKSQTSWYCSYVHENVHGSLENVDWNPGFLKSGSLHVWQKSVVK